MVVNVLLVVDVKFVMAAALSLVLEWRLFISRPFTIPSCDHNLVSVVHGRYV